jgi:MOSC domain-containing protein YiiM
MNKNPSEVLKDLAELPAPDADSAEILGLVLRPQRGERKRVDVLHLTPEGGIAGDRWGKVKHKSRKRQVSAMRSDVLTCLAGQADPALSGDNLHLNLDLSESNLPTGTRIQIAEVIFQVSPEPHRPCEQFVARFGQGAHDAVLEASWIHRRGRGVLLEVLVGGTIRLGDMARVIRTPKI